MKRQVRLSHVSFALILEEMLSGPCTVPTLVEHTGMTHRYLCQLMRTLHEKKVVHLAGWEKDSIGRDAVRTWALGPGKDAKRSVKTRQQVNKDYRTRADRAALSGTPFMGLGA